MRNYRLKFNILLVIFLLPFILGSGKNKSKKYGQLEEQRVRSDSPGRSSEDKYSDFDSQSIGSSESDAREIVRECAQVFRDVKMSAPVARCGDIREAVSATSSKLTVVEDIRSQIPDLVNSHRDHTHLDLDYPITIGKKQYRYKFNRAKRTEGLRRRQIIDDRNPKDLEPGSYNYVITEDGHISYGRVNSTMEYISKHLALADGRRVVAAGEMRINSSHEIDYNLLSGNFSLRLIEDQNVKEEHLNRLVSNVWRKLGVNANFNNISLLPTNQPSASEIKIFCDENSAIVENRPICRR